MSRSNSIDLGLTEGRSSFSSTVPMVIDPMDGKKKKGTAFYVMLTLTICVLIVFVVVLSVCLTGNCGVTNGKLWV